MQTKIEQICSINEQILEEYFKDMRSIIYTRLHTKTKLKMLYAAKHSAEYFMRINNGILRKLNKNGLE